MSDDLKTIVPFSTAEPFEPELGRLLHPTRFFLHPRDVVRDDTLTTAEKRAILSSWASDARAIESTPALRQIPGSDCVVPFDDVIDALQELDEKSDGGDSGGIEGSQPGHRDRHRGGDQEKGPTGSGIWY